MKMSVKNERLFGGAGARASGGEAPPQVWQAEGGLNAAGGKRQTPTVYREPTSVTNRLSLVACATRLLPRLLLLSPPAPPVR